MESLRAYIYWTEDKVYAVVDKNKDFKADGVNLIAKGLTMPNGVANKDGTLL